MKSVGLLLVLCLFVSPAYAACPPDGVQLYPAPGSVVPTNTRLLLEGVGGMAGTVAGLPGRILRMQTDGHEVEVRVQSGWTSSLGRSTVILRLSRPLKPGLVYTLRLDDVLPGARVLNGGGASLPEWNSGRGQDTSRPRWIKRPVVSEGSYMRTRDGVSRFVKLRMSLGEDSPAYALVSLSRSKDKTNMAPQHYVIPLHDGVALLGHGPCGGGFALEEGKSYRAKIDVFDAAGNLVTGGAPLQFESPVVTQENP
ncbi:MAG: hypothetical protein ABW123_13725 [Cystobacter sp.]